LFTLLCSGIPSTPSIADGKGAGVGEWERWGTGEVGGSLIFSELRYCPSVDGLTDNEHNLISICMGFTSSHADAPSPATTNITPAKRISMERNNYLVNNKRRLTPLSLIR
jgi:hypothetical protein